MKVIKTKDMDRHDNLKGSDNNSGLDTGFMPGGLILLLILAFIISLPFWINTAKPTRISQEDGIVVEGAESMLWDYLYIYTPEWGWKSSEDSHKAFLI